VDVILITTAIMIAIETVAIETVAIETVVIETVVIETVVAANKIRIKLQFMAI
jgi:hypothetical protein